MSSWYILCDLRRENSHVLSLFQLIGHFFFSRTTQYRYAFRRGQRGKTMIV